MTSAPLSPLPDGLRQARHGSGRTSLEHVGERTIAGNRIDDRLALGFARTLLNRVESRYQAALPPAGQVLPIASRSDRIHSLRELARSFGPFFIGIVPRKNYWLADLATYFARRNTPEAPICGISVAIWSIDLRSGGLERPSGIILRWPFSSVQMVATVDIHAIARIIQRSPRRSQAEIFGLLRDAACWSRVALAEGNEDPGSWMMPTRDGLLCATTRKMDDSIATALGRPSSPEISVIKTFIDRSRFRIQHSGAWQRLVDCGGLEAPPRLLDAGPVSERHRQLWQVMRDEGRGWDIRRRRAEARQAATDGSTFADDGEESIETFDDDGPDENGSDLSVHDLVGCEGEPEAGDRMEIDHG